VWWHIVGVFIIALLLFFVGKTHNSWAFVMQSGTVVNPLDATSVDGVPKLFIGATAVNSPFFGLFPGMANIYKAAPFGFVFVLAFLQAQWTYTGYDGSAHMAEETILARLNSAWGIFLSVAVSSVVGYLMLMAFTFAIPDITATATDAYPVLYIAYQNLAAFWAGLIAVIVFFGMWLCGLASITSMSRMIFAFARDKGFPGWEFMKQIHPRLGTPVNSIIVTSILAVLICLYSSAYFVVTSISTITLYIAYNIPTFLNVRNKMAKKGEFTTKENAPWNLGTWGPLLSVIAVVYTVFIWIVFVLPPNELVLWTMVGLGVLLAIYWFGWEKARFKGPTKAEEAELRRIEADMAARAKGKGDD
jgi:amino acid transporter